MATDAFTYSNGRLSTVASGVWTDSSAVVAVASNQVIHNGSNNAGIAFYQTQVGHADHYVQLEVNSGTADYCGGGGVVRGNNNTGSPTGYRGELGTWNDGGVNHNVAITRYNGGSTTEISVSLNVHNEASHFDVVRVEAEGTTISVYVGGVLEDDVTDATYQTGQWTGLYVGEFGTTGPPTVIVDNWENGTLGAGPADLVVADALHAHTADAVALTQTHVLTVADATQGHTADGSLLLEPSDLAELWFSDFASETNGNFTPRDGWISNEWDDGDVSPDSRWQISTGGDDKVLTGNAPSHVHYNTQSVNHEVAALVRLTGINIVGGVMVGGSSETDEELIYVGFELVVVDEFDPNGPENKIVVYYRNGGTHDEFFEENDYGLSTTGEYELRLRVFGGFVTAWINDVEVLRQALTGPQAASLATGGHTRAGPIEYMGGVEFEWVSVRTTVDVLGVDDALHGHTVDNVVLTQVHSLLVADALHAHTADALALTQDHTLGVADALQGHTVDALTLTQTHVLTVADALQGHTVDNVVLDAGGDVHNLVVQDALHGHAVDNVTLTQTHALLVADARQGHTVDVVVLTQLHVLVVADALHGHTVEQPTFTGGTTLTVADAAHGHNADALTLTQTHVLVVQDAGHTHTADTPTLTQLHVLAVADATHGHTVDNVTLAIGSIILIVTGRFTATVLNGARTATVLDGSRTAEVNT